MTGFDPDAPMPPVAAGTLLSSGQLFGSHLFQNLKKFGAGLNQSGLLQLGEKLFVDAAGYLPNPIDRAIITGIVGILSGKKAGSADGRDGRCDNHSRSNSHEWWCSNGCESP